MIMLSIIGIIFLCIIYGVIGLSILNFETENNYLFKIKSIYWYLLDYKLQNLCKSKPNNYKYDQEKYIYWYYKDNSNVGIPICESPDINLFDSILYKIILIFWPIFCIVELIRIIINEIRR